MTTLRCADRLGILNDGIDTLLGFMLHVISLSWWRVQYAKLLAQRCSLGLELRLKLACVRDKFDANLGMVF